MSRPLATVLLSVLLGAGAASPDDASEALLGEARTAYFRSQAGRELVDIVEDKIRAKLEEKDKDGRVPSLADVTAWSRRDLSERAFAALAERMSKRDPVTADEARAFWDGRPKRTWRRVSYGSGTFILRPPVVKAAQPPPTRNLWWEKAEAPERAQWVLAFFAESSELFEVGAREQKPCSRCNGVGLIDEMPCARCRGARTDVVVKYR